jgi:hypothetical protein
VDKNILEHDSAPKSTFAPDQQGIVDFDQRRRLNPASVGELILRKWLRRQDHKLFQSFQWLAEPSMDKDIEVNAIASPFENERLNQQHASSGPAKSPPTGDAWAPNVANATSTTHFLAETYDDPATAPSMGCAGSAMRLTRTARRIASGRS